MTREADGAMPARRLELVRPGDLRALLTEGTRAQHDDGDLEAGRQCFERAYRLAEQAGDTESMALAALGLAGLWVREGRTVTSAVLLEARLQHVLALLPEGSPLALRIRTRLAGEADYARGTHAGVMAALDEVRATGDPALLAEALRIAHHCLLGPEHVTLRRELAVELTKAAFRTDRRSDLLMGLLWQTADAYCAGDRHAGRLLGELKEHLKPRDHLAVGFVVSAIDVMLAIRAGRFAEAEELAAVCARRGAAAGDADHEWWAAAQLVTIRWYQGRLAEVLPALHERVHSPVLSAVDNSAVAALAVAAAMSGDRHQAASSLAALCGTDLAALPRSSSWLVTMHGVVEAACLLAEADVAAQAYALLRPYADLPMIGSLGVTCFGSTRHTLGVAMLTTRQPDLAIEHLTAAVRQNLAMAHWPALLASRQRLAQAHLLRGAPGDADIARRELDLSGTEAAAIGLPVPDVPGVGGMGGAAGAAVAECHRVGRKWRLALRNRSVLVEDSIGLAHLAVLIANPRQEIGAADLVAGVAGLTPGEAGAAQQVLDHEAIAEYRTRLRSLAAEIEQPDPDPARVARARAERDWLAGQLSSAAGFAGRTRAFPDQPERARVAVGKAIRRALARITEADPVIGEHLRQTVHTGVRCSYWPGLPGPVRLVHPG
ncbi:MAG TPA: hypothetical protein VFQ68_07855 [Streptosporangiaceae bacterium]|nr:hypothetical protein [Streptosporangiaceae bacterium]